MNELLLELFSEEIPALMQEPAAKSYGEIFTKFLQENNIQFEKIATFSAPRRIVVHITGLPLVTQIKAEEFKGPKIDAPAKAIEGFCQNHQITQESLEVRSVKGVDYYFYTKQAKSEDISEMLASKMPSIIDGFVWPKSMYWGENDLKWIRPLRNILCILGGKVLKFQYGKFQSNNLTYGHRFLQGLMDGPELEVNDFAEYRQKLAENFIILDASERKEIIKSYIEDFVSKNQLEAKINPRLLDEVTGLAEFPKLLTGKIDRQFLSLPKEILVSSLEKNQKYFTLTKQGKIIEDFIFVADFVGDKTDIVVEGNQRVLSARLRDALYFYNQDLKKTTEQQLEALKQVTFHAKLGSLYEKSLRLKKLAEYIAPKNQLLPQAALICKCDITSEVVGEFPDLQGIMGYYDALDKKLDLSIAEAVRDHYKPQGMKDDMPSQNGALLSIIDKIDNLTGLFIAGEEPTGSKDPFALRRQALGIIRVILENKLHINLPLLVERSILLYPQTHLGGLQEKIMSFISERVKYYFKQDYPINIINAALDFNLDFDLNKMHLKIRSLNQFLADSANNELIATYKRVHNIAHTKASGGQVNIEENLLSTSQEQNLYQSLVRLEAVVAKLIEQEDYAQSYEQILTINAPLSDFFDNIMVKVEDQKLADNRLALLSRIKDLFSKIADFSKL